MSVPLPGRHEARWRSALTPPLARRLVHSGSGSTGDLRTGIAAGHRASLTGRGRLSACASCSAAPASSSRPPNSEFLCALIAEARPSRRRRPGVLGIRPGAAGRSDAASADIYAGAGRAQEVARQGPAPRPAAARAAGRSNVETLLSQGQRLTWVDEAPARRQMGLHRPDLRRRLRPHACTVDADRMETAVDVRRPPRHAADLHAAPALSRPAIPFDFLFGNL
ncbi:MAG: hypothetical protein MZV70_09060 [Desulfobacterales bacterium]|nr:hypothetical protein [Desulfobacterales bacterium]